MEKQKVLLSFVEKAPKQRQPSEILALTADGKRLVRLRPEAKRQKCQLLGVLTEKNSGDEPSSRRRIRIASKSEITTLRQQLLEVNDENYGISSGKSEDEADAKKQKIPRPANAFMLFANEWRKKLAVENPRESNKDISVRLGVLWKTMSKEVKEKYFALAREVDAEHKRKYPDYVYNPKEARLRKAMREQNRTQQPVNAAPSVSSSRLPTTASNGQQQQPGGLAIGAGANRIIGPWFPLGHTGSSAPPQPAAAPATHPKPILSPRVMAAHQRTLDKTKDVIRKQLQECAATGAFPAASPAYPVNGAQETSPDYCADFAAEGQQQKWHPYQNGVNTYHSRGASMSKMTSLHRGMQNAAPNPRAWGQFCNVPFPTSQNLMMQQRGNRHMVFLQEQQSHCGYPTAEMQMSYEAKMQEDLARRLHSSYSQEEHQQQQQQAKTPLTELQLEEKTEEAPRWTPTPRPPSSSSSCTPDGLPESETTPATQASKQPLPGFQQAFGSTEIGRFSRSELFASLVEAVNLVPTKSLLKSRTAFPYRTSPDDPSRQCEATKSESRKAQKWPTASEPRQPPPAHGRSHSLFARPTEDQREEHRQDECLDLRVPSKKKMKKQE